MFSLIINGVRVGCRRNGTRVDYDHECLLHHNGVNYPCRMVNVSLSGALVCSQDFSFADVQLGDTCALLLCTDPTSSFGEYTSRITRFGPSIIALYFLSIDF